MWFGIVSLFPEMFTAFESGITGRAIKKGLIELHFFNPRHYTKDKHQTVDDKPYGGGPGMLMMAKPLLSAIQQAKLAAKIKPKTIYLSPQGKTFNQESASMLSRESALIFVAGRYEGIDERILHQEVDEEWSIGDYILTGGELPTLVMMDAITRLIPGVVGDEESITQESFATGLLKYPQFTRPETIEDLSVPEILLSGHHRDIHKWRLKQSLGRTWLKRPDLLNKKQLTSEEKTLLSEFISEFSENNPRKKNE